MRDGFSDTDEAPKKIAAYLTMLSARAKLAFDFKIEVRKPEREAEGTQPSSPPPSAAPESSPPTSTGPSIVVELAGPDTPLLLARNAELLHAVEHLAAKILRLEPEEHDLISFDAGGYKAARDRDLADAADKAIAEVRTHGYPYAFAPMTSRERRLLHLILSKSGLPTASSGEGPRRFVVLYPEGASAQQPGSPTEARSDSSPPRPGDAARRTEEIRNRFRRR